MQDAALVRDIVADEQAVYWLSGPNFEVRRGHALSALTGAIDI